MKRVDPNNFSGAKTIILECPRHGIPFKMEASSDPVNEGFWRHYFCERCRKERMKGKDGATITE
jgi:hypothetical protein